MLASGGGRWRNLNEGRREDSRKEVVYVVLVCTGMWYRYGTAYISENTVGLSENFIEVSFGTSTNYCSAGTKALTAIIKAKIISTKPIHLPNTNSNSKQNESERI